MPCPPCFVRVPPPLLSTSSAEELPPDSSWQLPLLLRCRASACLGGVAGGDHHLAPPPPPKSHRFHLDSNILGRSIGALLLASRCTKRAFPQRHFPSKGLIEARSGCEAVSAPSRMRMKRTCRRKWGCRGSIRAVRCTQPQQSCLVLATVGAVFLPLSAAALDSEACHSLPESTPFAELSHHLAALLPSAQLVECQPSWSSSLLRAS